MLQALHCSSRYIFLDLASSCVFRRQVILVETAVFCYRQEMNWYVSKVSCASFILQFDRLVAVANAFCTAQAGCRYALKRLLASFAMIV